MKLSKGKKYKTRCGSIVEKLEFSENGTSYKFGATIFDPKYNQTLYACWLSNGYFLTEEAPHYLDIIEEIL